MLQTWSKIYSKAPVQPLPLFIFIFHLFHIENLQNIFLALVNLKFSWFLKKIPQIWLQFFLSIKMYQNHSRVYEKLQSIDYFYRNGLDCWMLWQQVKENQKKIFPLKICKIAKNFKSHSGPPFWILKIVVIFVKKAYSGFLQL